MRSIFFPAVRHPIFSVGQSPARSARLAIVRRQIHDQWLHYGLWHNGRLIWQHSRTWDHWKAELLCARKTGRDGLSTTIRCLSEMPSLIGEHHQHRRRGSCPSDAERRFLRHVRRRYQSHFVSGIPLSHARSDYRDRELSRASTERSVWTPCARRGGLFSSADTRGCLISGTLRWSCGRSTTAPRRIFQILGGNGAYARWMRANDMMSLFELNGLKPFDIVPPDPASKLGGHQLLRKRIAASSAAACRRAPSGRRGRISSSHPPGSRAGTSSC